MRIVKTLAVAATVLVGGSGAALAWGDMYMGDGTNDPNSMVAFPYKGVNNCPVGLQPISVNGVICCGTPTTTRSYVNRAGGHKKSRKAKMSHAPRVYAPEGVKGVVMR